MRELTEEEMLVINNLVEAWNNFVKLEVLHQDEVLEFKHAIHNAQRIVMSRPLNNISTQKILYFNLF